MAGNCMTTPDLRARLAAAGIEIPDMPSHTTSNVALWTEYLDALERALAAALDSLEATRAQLDLARCRICGGYGKIHDGRGLVNCTHRGNGIPRAEAT